MHSYQCRLRDHATTVNLCIPRTPPKRPACKQLGSYLVAFSTRSEALDIPHRTEHVWGRDRMWPEGGISSLIHPLCIS